MQHILKINFTHKCKDSGGSYDTSATADCDKTVGCEGISMASDHIENYSSGDIFWSVDRILIIKLMLMTIMKFWA